MISDVRPSSLYQLLVLEVLAQGHGSLCNLGGGKEIYIYIYPKILLAKDTLMKQKCPHLPPRLSPSDGPDLEDVAVRSAALVRVPRNLQEEFRVLRQLGD